MRRPFRLPRLRGHGPLEDVRRQVGDERVVAWADAAAGGSVVATPSALWVPTGGADLRRVPWETIAKAVWRDGLLTVTETDEVEPGVLAERAPWSLELTVPRNLPDTVRVRVTGSVGYSAHHKLRPRGGVRVVGRRVPGRDGLRWLVLYDDPGSRHDPDVRAQAAALVDAARAAAGGDAGD